MITIQVDEKACVSCTLCVDACETRVFAFDEAKGLPEVVNARECFGCLACSAVCPANAIDHTGVPHPMNFYYDIHSLDMLSKMTGDAADAVPAMAIGDVKRGLESRSRPSSFMGRTSSWPKPARLSIIATRWAPSCRPASR